VLHVMDGKREGLPSIDDIWKLTEEAGDHIHVGLVGGLEVCPMRPGRFYTWDP
jgi:hypothetical protein